MIFSTDIPNYSGILFNKSNSKTPFLNMMRKSKWTNSNEYVLSQDYSAEEGEIPKISEQDSVTAPAPTYVTREQVTNVTQIFMESLAITDVARSNMGALSGVNIAGQEANPINEWDWQTGNKMQKIARSIEKTFIQGKFHKSTGKTDASQTRGMDEAITTNVIDAENKALDVWLVNALLEEMNKNQADTTNLTLWLDSVSRDQINASAHDNNMTIVPPSRTVNGINISTLITPNGTIDLVTGEFIPKGTVYAFNFNYISPVEQWVPNKGNFYVTDLAKKGAADEKFIFGQIGLDYGNEFLHGKITGLNNKFDAPVGQRIFIVNAQTGTVSPKVLMNTTMQPVEGSEEVKQESTKAPKETKNAVPQTENQQAQSKVDEPQNENEQTKEEKKQKSK